MEITTLKEKGNEDEDEGAIEALKDIESVESLEETENVKDTAVIGIYDVKLKIADGIRFGFGFVVALIIWGIIFSIISLLGADIFMKVITNSMR